MKIILPLSIVLPRKTKADKVFTLNLNIYRNTHHMILAQAKTEWKKIVHISTINRNHKLRGTKFRFIYTIHPASKRKFDLGNVCSIIQKFTDDALIDLGIIPDDSYKIIPSIEYKIGNITENYPHCELEIITLK